MGSDPYLWGALLLAFGLLTMIAALSSLETAVLNARRSRLAQLSPPRGVSAALALLDTPEGFQASAHLAKSLAESVLYAAAALAGMEVAVLQRSGPLPDASSGLFQLAWPGILIGALCAFFAVTVLGETLPKAFAAREPDRLLVRCVGFVRVFTLLFTPVLWVTSRAARFLAGRAGGDSATTQRAAHSEEEIKLLVEGSAEEGVLEEDEKEMIQSIFEFTDTAVRQVMVPRIDIHSVSADATLDDVLQIAMESGHSRIPVYERTLDTVVGIVHVKDLIPFLVRGEREAVVRQACREPIFVPEGKMIDELLHEFRTHKSQMAIVVDEYGGTAGIVTLEDIVEEIVGEIEDEYDVEEHPEIEAIDTGDGILVDARMTIEDVNDQLCLELPRGDYETLGGFVFSLFGRPVEVGERVRYESLEFVVEDADGLRLRSIRILRPDEDSRPEPAESQPAAPA